MKSEKLEHIKRFKENYNLIFVEKTDDIDGSGIYEYYAQTSIGKLSIIFYVDDENIYQPWIYIEHIMLERELVKPLIWYELDGFMMYYEDMKLLSKDEIEVSLALEKYGFEHSCKISPALSKNYKPEVIYATLGSITFECTFINQELVMLFLNDAEGITDNILYSSHECQSIEEISEIMEEAYHMLDPKELGEILFGYKE